MIDGNTRHGLPIEAMPSDCIGWASPAPGVFVLPEPSGSPSAAASPADHRPHGASSAHYANGHGLAIFPEVPLWTTQPLALPAEASARDLDEATATPLTGVLEHIAPAADRKTAFLPAVKDTAAIMSLMARIMRDRPDEGSDQDLALTMPLRASGMLLRHIGAQLAASPDHPVLLREQASLDERFTRWCHDAQEALTPEPIALSRTAGFQIDTIIAADRTLTR